MQHTIPCRIRFNVVSTFLRQQVTQTIVTYGVPSDPSRMLAPNATPFYERDVSCSELRSNASNEMQAIIGGSWKCLPDGVVTPETHVPDAS